MLCLCLCLCMCMCMGMGMGTSMGMGIWAMCVCLAKGPFAQDANDLIAVEYMVVRDDRVVASLVVVPWSGSVVSGQWSVGHGQG